MIRHASGIERVWLPGVEEVLAEDKEHSGESVLEPSKMMLKYNDSQYGYRTKFQP